MLNYLMKAYIITVLCVIYTATCFDNFVSSSGSLCTALLVGRSRDRFPVVSMGIFSVVSPTEPCALRSNQPLKVSTRDFSWGKGAPVRLADDLPPL